MKLDGNKLRRKYFDHLDLHRGTRSMSDLGIRHPSLIDLNVLVEILIERLKELRSAKNLAKVVISEFFVEDIFLNHIEHTTFLKEKKIQNLFVPMSKDTKFDLVFAALPWALRLRKEDNLDGQYTTYTFKNKEKSTNLPLFSEDTTKTSYEYIRALDSMKMLSDEGIGICFLPSYFRTFELFKFREILNDNNLFIEAIIKTPENLLRKVTAVESIFVLVSRTKREKEFIMEPESIEAFLDEGIQSLYNQTNSESIKNGIWLESGSFEGFIKWNYQGELKKIAGDFSTYSQYKISDICFSINRAVGGNKPKPFKNMKDCIYLPLIGNKNAITQKNDMQIKEQNYFQLVIDNSIVLPEYLASFFNSTLGKTYIKSNKQGSTIPALKIGVLRQMEVGIPSMNQQKDIVRNIKKVNALKEKIEEFENTLSINPISDSKTLDKVDSMMEIILELSDADKVRSIVRRGEDICTEFKQTLSLDVAKQTKEKYITESALKTICAFFNTNGGDLVIGIDDDFNILGIEKELEKFHKGDPDKFLNTFKDLFKKHIGPEFYPFLNQKIVEVNGMKVFLVSCKPTEREVFMDKIDFYVRTTPATDKLEGPSQIDYIRTRFGA